MPTDDVNVPFKFSENDPLNPELVRACGSKSSLHTRKMLDFFTRLAQQLNLMNSICSPGVSIYPSTLTNQLVDGKAEVGRSDKR